MKKIIIILFLLSGLNLNAQNYDLIVTTTGDSIACQIDSITDNYIYFEMMINERWIHTYTSKSDCINYEFNTIDKRVVVFKSGSSYIKKISTFKLKAYYYDLIVTVHGDSIACNIDSITDSDIHFEMMVNNRWVHTYTPLREVTEYKYDTVNKKLAILKPESSYIQGFNKPLDFSDNSLYANRYIFAPSAFGMKKGLRSYTNYDIFLQDFQYGFSDNFSCGFGTTIFFIPIYIMPTFTYQINDKSAFTVGDLFMFSPYPDLTFFGNLFYGMYSRGNLNNNFSVGIGLWTTTESDIMFKTTSPAFNISASVKTTDNIYFLTENYFVQMYDNTSVLYEYHDNANDIHLYDEVELSQNINVIFGISGFRFISRSNPINSLQIGLVYIFIFSEEIPQYNQPNWVTYDDDDNVSFIPIPFISYSRKF